MNVDIVDCLENYWESFFSWALSLIYWFTHAWKGFDAKRTRSWSMEESDCFFGLVQAAYTSLLAITEIHLWDVSLVSHLASIIARFKYFSRAVVRLLTDHQIELIAIGEQKLCWETWKKRFITRTQKPAKNVKRTEIVAFFEVVRKWFTYFVQNS